METSFHPFLWFILFTCNQHNDDCHTAEHATIKWNNMSNANMDYRDGRSMPGACRGLPHSSFHFHHGFFNRATIGLTATPGQAPRPTYKGLHTDPYAILFHKPLMIILCWSSKIHLLVSGRLRSGFPLFRLSTNKIWPMGTDAKCRQGKITRYDKRVASEGRGPFKTLPTSRLQGEKSSERRALMIGKLYHPLSRYSLYFCILLLIKSKLGYSIS